MKVSPIPFASWKLRETTKIKQEWAAIKSHSYNNCRLKRQMHGIIKYNAFFLDNYFLKKQTTATTEAKYVFLTFPCFWECLRSLCIEGPAKRTREATASQQLLWLPILLQLPCAHQYMRESCTESGSCSQSYKQWQFQLEFTQINYS